jgi:hypothetical protein
MVWGSHELVISYRLKASAAGLSSLLRTEKEDEFD